MCPELIRDSYKEKRAMILAFSVIFQSPAESNSMKTNRALEVIRPPQHITIICKILALIADSFKCRAVRKMKIAKTRIRVLSAGPKLIH